MVSSTDELRAGLAGVGYFADSDLATSLYLALRLERPLLLEGEAGVGKTEVAKALSRLGRRPLIRLQCYEGLDLQSAAYEWDYRRQLLYIRLHEADPDREEIEQRIYSREFLLERPLLQALTFDSQSRPSEDPPVLLIDELDRADAEFEAFLLEILSEFQITVPELGTIRAKTRPTVIITSNRTRDLHDALRRRCLYQWIDYPSRRKELEILRAKVPEATEGLARQAVAFVHTLRDLDLFKRPGVAESLDWIAGLVALDQKQLEPEVVDATLGLLLKYQDDIELVRGNEGNALAETLARAGVVR